MPRRKSRKAAQRVDLFDANFGYAHKTLHATSAMQTGIADHAWSLAKIAAPVFKPVAKKRCPYRPRNSD